MVWVMLLYTSWEAGRTRSLRVACMVRSFLKNSNEPQRNNRTTILRTDERRRTCSWRRHTTTEGREIGIDWDNDWPWGLDGTPGDDIKRSTYPSYLLALCTLQCNTHRQGSASDSRRRTLGEKLITRLGQYRLLRPIFQFIGFRRVGFSEVFWLL